MLLPQAIHRQRPLLRTTGIELSLLTLPQIKRFLPICFKWQCYFAAGAGGFVGREDDFKDGAAVLSRHNWLFVVLNAIDKMRHFLRKTVVPLLLVNREAPAFSRAGFLDGVIV